MDIRGLFNQKYTLRCTILNENRKNKKKFFKLEQSLNTAGKGHINILKYLIETYGNHDVKITTKSMNCAASNGHLQVLKWMYQTGDSTATVCNHLGLDAAADNRKLETVQFLLEMKVIPNLAAAHAAHNGHLDILIALDQFNHLPTTTVALDNAAARGHMKIVRFLHSRQAKCTTNAINYAAYNGHYQVVHFLLENRSEGCTREAMDLSSMHGHLDIVKLLHERSDKGCSQSAVDLAAGNCHFHVVQFLIENRKEGCSVYALSNAIIIGHLPMFQYLAEKTAFLKDEEVVERLYEIAKSHDKLEIVEFLKNNFTHLQSLTIIAKFNDQSIYYRYRFETYSIIHFLLKFITVSGQWSRCLIQRSFLKNSKCLEYLYRVCNVRLDIYGHQDYQDRGFSDANESTVGDGPATQSQGVLLRYIYYQQQQQQLQQRQQQHFEILSIRLITIEIIKCNAETITFRADLQISMTIVNSGDQKCI
ncbi:ankyrin repeat-containing protein [Heterostelium album PN500]|uniref:Ankyrin repeat-containing protein n=1 Tax=Heterostelium pallidum (strain ATCC 26659 / Pp 5 / PN500) TaxID=670386 RepID=D3BGA7_HETP5|nr:ankyrin repeat-containing protein [Heterostelium album PN500]EFA79507.1 ankyrin repeat-containing protein [Heterostelium album PN500]|eukprot:XP_020431628.1 ankyrin repeat-containing protein [Heterostelium album PN500]